MRTAECHPELKHFAKGRCQNCYMREFRRARPEYREYMRVYLRGYLRRPEKREALRRMYRNIKLRSKYSIEQKDVEQYLIQQNGVCAICLEFLPIDKVQVDHDHESGVVRGLLCRACNTALGLFRDKIDRLTKAIEYLSSGSKAKTDLLARNGHG